MTAELFAYFGPFLAGVLLLAAVAKARAGLGGDAALRSALGVLVRPLSRLVIAWRGLVALEVALAIALLVLPARASGIAAAAFFLVAAAYAVVALRVAPDRSCGCFGAADEPASRLTVVRAVLLAFAAGAYAAAAPSPATTSPRAWIGVAVVAVLTFAVSSEWRAPFQRRFGARRLRNCSRAAVDTDAAVARIRGTKAWRAVEEYLVRREPSDSWREGCWQLFSFEAAVGDDVATAVFAISLQSRRASCRAMLRRGITGPAILETPEERMLWARLSALARSS